MAKKDDWNPMGNLDSRVPTKECLKRVRSDMKKLSAEPLPGIFCVPDDLHATVVHAVIVGPFG